MTIPLEFDRELDVRNASDRDALIAVVCRQPGAIQHQLQQVTQGVEFLAHFFPQADWLRMSPYSGGSFQVKIGPKATSSFPLDNAVQLGLQLGRLQMCDGFASFLRGFNNPSQFFDSVFEAAMAAFCLEKAASLKFSPLYIVKGKKRRPDFEVQTNLGKIVCECKRLRETERLYSKRLSTLAQALDLAAAGAGGVPQESRLEVHIRGPVKGDANKLAKQLCDAALRSTSNIGKVLELGPFQFCLALKTSHVHFPDTEIFRHSVTVGDKPVGATSEYAYLRVTIDGIGRSRSRATGDLIHETKSQLPETEMCVAFVEVMNGPSAEKAAHGRIGRKEYQHFLAVGISSPRNLRFVYRQTQGPVVEGIFGPFTSMNAPA